MDLRRNPGLRGRVRELHHAINITFTETGAYKMTENNRAQALIRSVSLEVVGGVPPTQPRPAQVAPGEPAAAP